jgi:hypothetical protein
MGDVTTIKVRLANSNEPALSSSRDVSLASHAPADVFFLPEQGLQHRASWGFLCTVF